MDRLRVCMCVREYVCMCVFSYVCLRLSGLVGELDGGVGGRRACRSNKRKSASVRKRGREIRGTDREGERARERKKKD